MSTSIICTKCGRPFWNDEKITAQEVCTCPPKEYAKGWECPRCGKISSPLKDSCDCFQYERVNQRISYVGTIEDDGSNDFYKYYDDKATITNKGIKHSFDYFSN